jgi:hypothetical protein
MMDDPGETARGDLMTQRDGRTHLNDQQFYDEASVQLDTVWQLCGVAMELEPGEDHRRIVLIDVIGHYVQQVQELLACWRECKTLEAADRRAEEEQP